MKTFNVTLAHGTDVIFSGKRTAVKSFINNHKLDPESFDVLENGNRIKRVMGADFIEVGYKWD